MNNLSTELKDLKEKYRKIFQQTSEEILAILQKEQDNPLWQKISIKNLTEYKTQQTKILIQQINSIREQYNCQGCGTCCKFAVSEYSPKELEQKANDGDNFAKQFISTFIPYENIDEVKTIYPQYVELLMKNETLNYYFYHCPKVTSNNRCPDYKNRPQICKDFPDNPIAFLPKTCGYKNWKVNSEALWFRLNAIVEITSYYIEQLKT